MRQRFRTKRRENLVGMRLAILVLLLLTVVVGVRGAELKRQQAANEARIEELTLSISSEEKRSDEIAQFTKKTQTRGYIEQVAREKLGLVYPGEIIFEKDN
ncbi:septum formation initiator family protein [Butyrivibrio sp. MC2013]|uniref:septum formation initiator family protein n=1 Tax=Butyrivibrio sp. MC2013 TaxID=1280686 RepID=UPI00047B2BA3|nr:septum formation initiator family protein [Butyrivibrio sp. MC2013]